MKYQNPPVVEVGITFNFKPSGNTPEWGEDVALEFIKGFENFQKPEYVFQQVLHVETDLKNRTTKANAPPPNFSDVCVRSKDGLEILGIRKNCLTYHKIRSKDGDFPRYTSVVEKILEYLPRYQDFWKPEEIKNAELIYLDVIPISSEQINLDDYFKIGIKFPDEFGSISDFESHLVFPPSESNISLDLRFRKVRQSSPNMIFHILWNCQKDIHSSDPKQIREEMDLIHHYVYNCFDLSFTKEGKELFGKVE